MSSELNFPVLSWLIFLPVVGGLICLAVPRNSVGTLRGISIAFALINLVLASITFVLFDTAETGFQFIERLGWLSSFGIWYSLGIDGVSLALILLTTTLTVIALLGSFTTNQEHTWEITVFTLFLSGAVIGSFAARDLILFFMFWEFMLVPMYILVATAGGPDRAAAAMKFFIYTAAGSLLMLVAILSLQFTAAQVTGQSTFELERLMRAELPAGTQQWLFLGFALAFAIKTPIFPLHTWLPSLYRQSPAATLIVATMLAKVGAYGFIRIAIPLFPDPAATYGPWLAGLGIVSIIYGGLAALSQRDMINVLAYSSIAHLGFIVLGIFADQERALLGAVVQMVNHGLSAGMLFALAAMIHARTGSYELSSLGGLAARWPAMAAFTTLAIFSAAGLPGLNGFVGEFLLLSGLYETRPVEAIIALGGIVIGVIYLLRLVGRILHGPAGSHQNSGGSDIRILEAVTLVPLVILIVAIGLYPRPLLRVIEPATSAAINTSVESTDSPISNNDLPFASTSSEEAREQQ